ncbi:MAG: hypothetical protein V4720_13900 [Pseudomonadota bacterium]|uniref:hypothetical protein n=1 Tax=Tabrizicola sp. TaxID=2005166 RepID=UPI0025E11841|nr:hypothetical protein [Tabrizicola sp.]
MPQDSGPESKKESDISAAAARILDEVKAEPVPDSIRDLAHELDRTLRAKRKAGSQV